MRQLRQQRQLRHTNPRDIPENDCTVAIESGEFKEVYCMMFDPFAQTSSWGYGTYGGTQPYGYGPQQLFPTLTGFGVSPQFSGFGFQGVNPWAQGILPFAQGGLLPQLSPQVWLGGQTPFGQFNNPIFQQVAQQIPQLVHQAQQIAQQVPQLAQQIPQLIQQNPQLVQQAPQLQHIPQLLQQAALIAQQVPQLLQALSVSPQLQAGAGGYRAF